MAVSIVDKVADVQLTTAYGDFLAGAYTTRDVTSGRTAEHMLLYRDTSRRPCLLRINSACYTSDIFADTRCDCSWQLQESLRLIDEGDHGLLIYHLHHEGRANGLVNKLRGFGAPPRRGGPISWDAYERLGLRSDARQYVSTVAILQDLGITDVALLTNNPAKERALVGGGITVRQLRRLRSTDPAFDEYYDNKRTHLGHDV
jgi:3,4-dihydroxy 2-butanone 4-phosphate synthase/GTP cyclohydrolase II